MSYSDFTLKSVKNKLGVQIIESQNLFTQINEIEISQLLREILAENVPLARAINTEKARSELIISNILVEVRKMANHKISLFSGIEFNVNQEQGLNGYCDFILSASTEQLTLNAPIITIVEAKNENLVGALGQCTAEMVAASIFNEEEHNEAIKNLYGVVTTGTAWRFLKMAGPKIYIDLDEYSIENHGKILGILSEMVNQKA